MQALPPEHPEHHSKKNAACPKHALHRRRDVVERPVIVA
jgi:hypothetical protein